ncbi:MAG: LysM peptidoglycan-binding domain-containing protein [Anaerolineales bacterium]|nr:LysM peptidoglycan-binding domain-containing protein [Anaerolineales bacterium]
MRFQRLLYLFILAVFGLGAFYRPQAVRAEQPQLPSGQASAYDLILAMNTLRVSYGLPALIEDPIINAVAQSTAATMAINNMSWHIGNVRGRLAAAGYGGGGGTVWATENFAVSGGGMGVDEIMAVWADPDHMRPAVEPAYCHVGAGVATTNGKTYYILQAAYVSGQACGSSSSSPSGTSQPGVSPGSVPQIIIPVKIATPDAEGRVYHVVQAGQSFWSIAIAYQITIQDLETWNNLSRNIPLQTGQRLFIPNKNTEGYATPTPRGMVVLSAPDADGRIIHEVQPYQTLITIAEAYNVTVERILALNGLQADWPLQIGQKLLISPGNVTPSPTLSAIQRLTPEADGRYYHTVQSGETLSWISDLYNVPLSDLMSWNGLNNASVIRPDQKLLLLVTPPATATVTPAPATVTPSPQPSATLPPLPTATPTVPVTESPPGTFNLGFFLAILVILLGGGGWLWWKLPRRS